MSSFTFDLPLTGLLSELDINEVVDDTRSIPSDLAEAAAFFRATVDNGFIFPLAAFLAGVVGREVGLICDFWGGEGVVTGVGTGVEAGAGAGAGAGTGAGEEAGAGTGVGAESVVSGGAAAVSATTKVAEEMSDLGESGRSNGSIAGSTTTPSLFFTFSAESDRGDSPMKSDDQAGRSGGSSFDFRFTFFGVSITSGGTSGMRPSSKAWICARSLAKSISGSS